MTMMREDLMQKVTKIENGVTMVAVLYSPGYGSGWYTWNTDYPELIYDTHVVGWVLDGKQEYGKNELESYLYNIYENIYIGSGFDDLVVEWVPVGTKFIIMEYDGAEHVQYQDKIDWFVA